MDPSTKRAHIASPFALFLVSASWRGWLPRDMQLSNGILWCDKCRGMWAAGFYKPTFHTCHALDLEVNGVAGVPLPPDLIPDVPEGGE